MQEDIIESLTITIKLKSGEKIEVKDPKTLLFTYQNFDMEDMEKKYKKTGKYPIDPKMDVGGVQIFGKRDNVKFATFTLLKQLLDHLGMFELIDLVSKVIAIKMPDIESRNKLEEYLVKRKKDDVLN